MWTSGFNNAGYVATDTFCLNPEYNAFCYNTIFLRTYYVYNNYWLNYFPNKNIGGILGGGYFKNYT